MRNKASYVTNMQDGELRIEFMIKSNIGAAVVLRISWKLVYLMAFVTKAYFC